MNEQHDVDPRSESDRKVDEVLGAAELTTLDRQFAKILRHANDLFLNVKQTRKYLMLGEECDLYVRKAVDMGVKRSEAIARITDRLADAGMGNQDIRVNDWVAVYGLARLCTGADTVKDMDPLWVGSHAYRTLAILKVAIERDDTDYTFKPHWSENVREWLANGVRGRALEEATKQHAKVVEEHVRETRMKSLTPEKQHQLEMAQLSAERDKQVAAINKAAEQIRERAVKANLSPDDLLVTLVNRGIITPPEPVRVPMDSRDYAQQMDADQAAEFAKALIDRGNTAIVMAIASVLTGWLRSHADQAAA
jgi:hypothetical protein